MAETALGVDLTQFHWSVTVGYVGVYLSAIFGMVMLLGDPVEWYGVYFFTAMAFGCMAFTFLMARRSVNNRESDNDAGAGGVTHE